MPWVILILVCSLNFKWGRLVFKTDDSPISPVPQLTLRLCRVLRGGDNSNTSNTFTQGHCATLYSIYGTKTTPWMRDRVLCNAWLRALINSPFLLNHSSVFNQWIVSHGLVSWADCVGKVIHRAPKAHVIASKYSSGPLSHPEWTAVVSQCWDCSRALGTSATDLHAAQSNSQTVPQTQTHFFLSAAFFQRTAQ